MINQCVSEIVRRGANVRLSLTYPLPAKQPWPETLSEQAGAGHAALADLPSGATPAQIAKSYGRATSQRVERIEEILETLAALGKARQLDADRYVAM